MQNIYFHQTIIGRVGIAEENETITKLCFGKLNEKEEAEEKETPLIKEAFSQLFAYLDGKLQDFSLPLNPQGTEYMQKVWQALLKVPYGCVTSYKQIAISIGKPNDSRAIGLANNRNPIPVFIPCHRIVGANGKLVGYGGGLDVKRKLLTLEGSLHTLSTGEEKLASLIKL